jgi:RND family efflux transporter MFP subunit
MKKHSIIMALAIIISTGTTFVSCSGKKAPATEAETEEVLPDDIVEAAGIELGSIEMRPMKGLLKVNGVVTAAPQNTATVCMPMGGFVRSTSLVPGNTVVKGQTLAVLENQDFIDLQQNYLETRNRLEFAEADYQRHSELYKDDVYSQKNLQQVSTEYKNLKAQFKALEQKLSLLGLNPATLTVDNISRTVPVTAPISGYLRSVNVSIGKYVSPSDVLFEIINNDKLLLELTLFEKDAGKVAAGQKIRFYINNETEQHDAVIYQVGKSIGADKIMKVYASVLGTCRNVIPGMYVNADIETEGGEVAALPSDAIVSFDDKDYLFIYLRNKEEDGKPFAEYRMLEIHKGVTDNGFTEVILPPETDIRTMKVVIKGAYNLLSAKKNAGEMAC